MRRRAVTLMLLTVAFLVSNGATAIPSAPADNAAVRIRDMQFQPANVRIKVGGTVTWTNADDHDHSVSATDNSFKSGNPKTGSTFSFHFTKAGSFDYSCTYHPRMRGTVQVEN